MWVPAWGDEMEVLAFLATLLQSAQCYTLGMGKAMLTNTGAWCEDWPAYCVSGLGMEFVITQVWTCSSALSALGVVCGTFLSFRSAGSVGHVSCSLLRTFELTAPCLSLTLGNDPLIFEPVNPPLPHHSLPGSKPAHGRTG